MRLETKEKSRWFTYTSTTQTERLWPRVLASLPDVPEEFLSGGAFDAGVFPYAILVPENVVFVNGRAVRTNRKMVALFSDRIVFLEVTRTGLERKEHLLDRIRFLRVEDVLLSGVIELSSAAGFSRVGFNAARDDLFRPIVSAVRDAFNRRAASASAAPDSIRRNLEAVPRIPLKFVNYGMKSLRPGQEVEAIVFKESVNVKTTRKGIFRLIDHYSAPILFMKTGGELIVIEEPARVRSRKKMEYGGIFTYLPLEKISHFTVTEGIPAEAVIGIDGGETVRMTLPDAGGFSRFL